MADQALADELNEVGTTDVPVPDPDEAKVSELTAYCREVGTVPDDWTKMKAAEKRVAFRRLFFGVDPVIAFDPDDPIHVISQRVEKVDESEARSSICRLLSDVGMNYLELGGILLRVANEAWFSAWGHETFKDWLAAEAGMKFSKARYLINIYSKTVELDIAWSQVSDVGWSKLAVILPVIDHENMDEWLEKARSLTVLALKDEVQAAQQTHTGDGDGRDSDADEMVTINFGRVPAEQAAVINDALDTMMETNKTDSKRTALEWICAHYLTGEITTKPMVPLSIESVADAAWEIKVILLKVLGMVDSDFEALPPIIEAFEEVFTGAQFDVVASKKKKSIPA